MSYLIAHAEMFAWGIVAVLVLAALGLLYVYVKPAADLMAAAGTAALRFAGTRAGQITIAVGCCALALVLGSRYYYTKGYNAAATEYEARIAAEIAKRRDQVATFVLQATAAGDRADRAQRDAAAARAAKTAVITKEIPRYVTPAADRNCIVPAGFVQLHESARNGTVPAPDPGDAVDAPSGVALSDVAADYADAARLYDACRAQVMGLQDWYGTVRESFSTMRGAE